MPSWKKIITSGSSTAFHHITASGNISTSCEATMSTGLLDLCGPLQIGPSGIVRDPAGNDVITLATNTVDMTALTVGGGFGSTGVTVTSAGAISANGALTCSHGQFPVISVRGQGGIAISLGTGANFISDEGILTSRRSDSDAADTDIKSTKFTKADDTEAGFFAFNEQELKVKEHHLLADMDKDLAVKKQYRIQIGGSEDANEVVDFQEKRVKISVPLTASSDISASGKLIAANAQFGLGTVIIDGANITMSGQLSSSGTGTNILGGNLDFDGDRTIGTVGNNDDLSINPEAKLILGSSGTDAIEIGRQSGTGGVGRTEIYANTSTIAAKFQESQITFNHPVTASANISSSALLIASQSGIGLASPETVFHIQQPSGVSPELRVEGLGNTNSKLMLKNSQGNWQIYRKFTSKELVFENDLGDIPLILNRQHITASGDISSSGTITADNFIMNTNTNGIGFMASNGTVFNNILTNSADDFIVQNLKNSENLRLRAGQSANKGKVLIQQGGTSTNIAEFGPEDSVNISANITASIISASGTITADSVRVGDNRISFINNSNTIVGTSTQIDFAGSAPYIFTPNIFVKSHITASGNISASGTITAALPAGTDNSVVVLNSSNQLVTDEVDSSIFGGAGTLLTSDNANETLAGVNLGEVEAGIATTAKTQRTTTNAAFFPVMVDSTNASATAESLKTPTSGFTFNPATLATTLTNITASGQISCSGKIDGKAGLRIFEKTSNTDGDAQGDIVYFGGTTSMTAGDIYHYKSDGTWEQANASAVATCDGLLGVALGAASDINGVLLRGTVTVAAIEGTEAVGDVLFASTVAGHAAAAAPSSNNNVVRVIGYCLDATNGQILFDPDKTFVEVTA